MAEKPDVPERLRTAILEGRYAPRQRLIETELAAEYATTRFVIRNALITLAAEGLLELQPNRGARIRDISLKEAVEMMEVRRVVKGLIAARAAERVDDDALESLHSLRREMCEAVEAGELMRYSELIAALHDILDRIAAQEVASRMLLQLNGQLIRHRYAPSLQPIRLSGSLTEHLAIIDAVCSRDPEAARSTMEDHVSRVIGTLKMRAGAHEPEDAALL